jgi:hypothetical protein
VFELDSEAADDTQFLTDDDVNEIEVVAAPCLGEIASTIEMCHIFVGWISYELVKLPPEQQVIIVDGEWRVGSHQMDVLIICLPFSNYKVYIFQLTRMCNNDERHFSRALRKLLEDPKITKVGNRIPRDVAKLQKWNVEMGPVLELGHLMHHRALTPTCAPSLETIIDTLFPGVELEGKHDGYNSTRVSDWSMHQLIDDQINYSSNDGYSTAVALRSIFQLHDSSTGCI